MAEDAKKPVQTTIKKIVKTPLIKRIKAPTGMPVAPQVGGVAPAHPPVAPQPAARPENAPSSTEPPLPPEEDAAAPAPAQPAEPADVKPSGVSRFRHKSAEKPADKNAAAGKSPVSTKDPKKDEKDGDKKSKRLSVLKNKFFKLGVAVLVLIGLCYGVYASLPFLAEKKIPELFAANGMKLKSFKIKQLSISEMEMGNISDATGTLSVSSMKLDYSLYGLLHDGKLKSLTLSGVMLSGVRRDDSISLGILPQLISSSAHVQKGKELTIPKITIKDSSFVLKRETEQPKTDEEGNPIDENIVVAFSGSGTYSSQEQVFKIVTSSDTPSIQLKTETDFTKNNDGTSVAVKITEGTVRKGDTPIGTVKGTMETLFAAGVMTKGNADLSLVTPEQTLKLKTEVVPVNDAFNVSAHFERNIENKEMARGKFVGNFDIESEGLKINGTFRKFEGTLPLKLSSAMLKNGKVAFGNLKIQTVTDFKCEEAKCTFALKSPMPVAFDNAELTTTYRRFTIFKPVVVSINPDPREMFLETDGGNLFLNAPLSDFVANVFMSDPVSSLQFGVMMKMAKAHVRTNVFSGAFGGDLQFDQSVYADSNFKLNGFQGNFSFASGTLPTGRFRVQMMEPKRPDTFAPMALDVSVKPMGGSGEIGFGAQGVLQNGKASFTADGSFDLPSHAWNMYFNVPKIILSEDGLPLETIAPFLKDILSPKTSGGFTAKGRLKIEGDKVFGPMRVLLDNISTEWKGVKFSGVSGLMNLTGIKPLETPDNQLLFAGAVYSGIPFDNVQANYRIIANRGIQVLNLGMHYAGGQFRTIRPFFYPYDGQPSLLMMEGSGLDLTEITENLRSSALSATGTLNSEWTISFAEKGLNIDSAKLITRLPGDLHFMPSADVRRSMAPKETEFLKNVIVKKLGLAIEGPMNGILNFKVKIQGRSPLAETDTNFGYDFKANFKTLLKDTVKPVNIPSDVLLQIQSFEK